jgi:hypothetical protein
MNVGIVSSPVTVSWVRSTGPKPTMPSTPVKPCAVFATPIDCLDTVRPPKVTESVYSVPETSPEPYETWKASPVETPVVPFLNLVVAPTQRLDEPTEALVHV